MKADDDEWQHQLVSDSESSDSGFHATRLQKRLRAKVRRHDKDQQEVQKKQTQDIDREMFECRPELGAGPGLCPRCK